MHYINGNKERKKIYIVQNIFISWLHLNSMMQLNYSVKCRHDITINQTVVLQFSKWQSMKIIISTLCFQLPYTSQLSSDIWRGWMYPLLSWRTPNLTLSVLTVSIVVSKWRIQAICAFYVLCIDLANLFSIVIARDSLYYLYWSVQVLYLSKRSYQVY